jgi:signal transduction histidine kinase
MATHTGLKIRGSEYLIEVSQELSLAHTLEDVIKIARRAARELCGADGATFILREGNLCHYVDEDAISPLWKGQKFPLENCISGWCILNGKAAVIDDIYADPRIPHDAYRPTFVKSLVMVPIREKGALGAIGNYWARQQKASDESVVLLRSLANLIAIALENVQLVRELRNVNSTLTDALRSRDEFLSIASHELKTPLSSLLLQLQMLVREAQPDSRKKPTTDRVKNVADISLRQAKNLSRLIENLMDVSRIRLDRIDLNATTFDLSDVVREVLEQFGPQIQDANCKLEASLESGIEGSWDRLRLVQVMTNLISNACKYARGANLKVQTSRAGNQAMLVVADSGPGIKNENQGRLFERFERLGNESSIGGLGLGLFITKRLVDAHHGNIAVESEEGMGTKFIVRLPFSRTLS